MLTRGVGKCLFFKFTFYWSVVKFQCCVHYCSTAKWLSYMYSFSCSFPLWFITGCWIQFPMRYSRTLLFIHAMYTSLHLLIPKLPLLPFLTLLPPATTVCSLCLWFCLCFIDKFMCVIVEIPHVSDVTWCLSVWLPALSVIIFVSIYVVENGI